jgi:hypothetical protein
MSQGPPGSSLTCVRELGQALLDGVDPFRLEGPGRGDFGAHDMLVFEQPIAIGRQEVGQEDEPIALARITNNWRGPGDVCASRVQPQPGLPQRRHGGFSSTFQSGMLPEELDECRKMTVKAEDRPSLRRRRRRARGVSIGGGLLVTWLACALLSQATDSTSGKSQLRSPKREAHRRSNRPQGLARYPLSR